MIGDAVEWLTKSFQEKPPEWISAIAAAVSALAVLLAMWQLRTTKKIHQLEFEDGLDKEYRDLISRIPTKALLGKGLSPAEYRNAFDEFYRYFDLCNQQIILRRRHRVSVQVWAEWSAGIRYNLQLPPFRKAWETIQQDCESFQDLRKLEACQFICDPAKWPRGT